MTIKKTIELLKNISKQIKDFDDDDSDSNNESSS